LFDSDNCFFLLKENPSGF